MQKLQTLSVTGELVARQPLAVSPPGAAWSGDKSTQRLARFGFGSGALHYIPASTLRHVIRYRLARVVHAALSQHGKKLSVAALLALDKGFVMRRKGGDGKKLKVHEQLEQEMQVRARNPLLSMLGTWGVPSELRVLNIIPLRNETVGSTLSVASGWVRKLLEDDLVEAMSDEDRQAYLEAVEMWADEAKKEKGKDGKETGLKNFNERPWEEVTPGTVCSWGYAIHRVDPLKSGAVLAALRDFAADPVIGAHRAAGRGEVAIFLSGQTITHTVLQEPQAADAGSVRIERGVFEVSGALADDLRYFDEQARAGFPDMDFDLLPEVSGND